MLKYPALQLKKNTQKCAMVSNCQNLRKMTDPFDVVEEIFLFKHTWRFAKKIVILSNAQSKLQV